MMPLKQPRPEIDRSQPRTVVRYIKAIDYFNDVVSVPVTLPRVTFIDGVAA